MDIGHVLPQAIEEEIERRLCPRIGSNSATSNMPLSQVVEEPPEAFSVHVETASKSVLLHCPL